MFSISSLSTDPLPSHKLWAIWIWNRTICRDDLVQQLCAIAEAGFGGVAIRPGRDMNPSYMSEDFLELFHCALLLCKDKKLRVRIADDFSAPWCSIFQDACNRYKSMRLKRLRLEYSEVISAKGAFSRDIIDPGSAIILAASLKDSLINLASTKVIAPPPAGKNRLEWKPPASADEDWRVMIFRKTDAKNPVGLYLPNVFSPKTADVYIKSYLEPLRERFSRFVPSPFEGFITEMPAIIPDESGIPWDDNMIVRYRSKYKKDLVKLLPCLFFEVSNGFLRHRPHILSFLAQAIYDNFAEPLEKWGTKKHWHQWLLCAEQNPLGGRSLHYFFYGMPQGKYKNIGWQNIDGTFKNLPMLYAAFSMNAVESKRHTIVVIGRNRTCTAGTLQSLKNEIQQNLSIGDCTLLLDGLFFNLDHRTHVKTPFNPHWYSSDWRFMPQLCFYAAHLRAVSQNLQPVRNTAVLFPSVAVQAEYLPENADVVSGVWSRLERLVDQLRRLSIGFDILSEETLLSCSIKPTGYFVPPDKTLQTSYSALILPYFRFISKSLFVFLEKLEAKSGTIIFIDDAPQGSLDEGSTHIFLQRVEKLLKSRHGKVVVVASTELQRLREFIQPAVEVSAQGKENADIIATSRVGKEYSLVFAWNPSETSESHATIDMPHVRNLYNVDCTMANTFELSPARQSEKLIRYGFSLQPCESLLLLGSKTKVSVASRKVEKKSSGGCELNKQARNYRVVLRHQWKLLPRSPNVLPLSSWSIRIGLSKEFGGYSHYCETYFEVKELPSVCCMLLNEFFGLAGSDFSLDKSFELMVNGSRIAHFFKGLPPNAPDGSESPLRIALKGLGYVRSNVVCDLRDSLSKGYNRISLRSVGLVGDPPVILYPPLIVGDFSLERGAKGWTIGNASPTIGSESWTQFCFPYLSGEASYVQVFEVPSTYERLVLAFSRVSGPVSVSVNGMDFGWKLWQPLEFDVTKACTAKRNELIITVMNTVDNVLRLNGRPSGLLGDVFLDVY